MVARRGENALEDLTTYYEILEVAESASFEGIRTAYRRMAQEYHPDRVPEHLKKLRRHAEEKLKQINEAWAVLGNAAKRQQYDAELKKIRGGNVEKESDGVTVLELDGRIVLGEESNAFRERVKALLASGKTKIVLNMANVTYIDSAGLGTLVALHRSAWSQGATLRLAQLGAKYMGLFQVTKLLTVFDVYPTEAEAVDSFAK
jgi:anti-sigma B factor antagonist